MKGTEKQIAWARKIKDSLLEDLEDLEEIIERYQNLGDSEELPRDYASVLNLTKLAKPRGGYIAAIAAIKRCDSARWFIDHGQNGGCAALRAAMSGNQTMGGLI
jgi:hypothetical protein